jgi:PAS domain S-box-containing protein
LNPQLTDGEKGELERLREEAARLRESEQGLRALLDESSDPVFSLTAEGRYRYVNQAFASGVRRRREEIVGHTLWEVF